MLGFQQSGLFSPAAFGTFVRLFRSLKNSSLTRPLQPCLHVCSFGTSVSCSETKLTRVSNQRGRTRWLLSTEVSNARLLRTIDQLHKFQWQPNCPTESHRSVRHEGRRHTHRTGCQSSLRERNPKCRLQSLV